MTKLTCPNCSSDIDTANVNVKTDLAQCSNCHAIHRLSHLIAGQELDALLKAPADFRASVLGDANNFEILLPRQGLKLSVLPVAMLPILWTSFLAFWTWGAAQNNIFFALFSIPFWTMAVFMILGLLNSIFETQKLTLSEKTLTVSKSKVEGSESIECGFNEILSIKRIYPSADGFRNSYYRFFMRNPFHFAYGKRIPSISLGGQTEFFFESASIGEQEWIVNILNSWMRRNEGNLANTTVK